MSLATRVLNVFRARALEREFEDEIRFHLEQRVQQNLRLGMSRDDAENDARARLGSVEQAKAGMRAARVLSVRRAPLIATLGLAAAALTGGVLVTRWPAPVYELTDGVSAPVPIDVAKAQYPPLAKQAKVQGAVRVRCVVRPSGRCTDVVVVRSLDARLGLDAEAVRAVGEWRFHPATRDGSPVSTRIDLEVRFALR